MGSPANLKRVNTLILDTGPIIGNDPPISSLIAQCQTIVSDPAILSEIKDEATKSRFETTWRPFMTLREPRVASLKVITDFARKTGDLAVLSMPDLRVLALAYEVECELNGGDWRLRSVPGQKTLNGPIPEREKEAGIKRSSKGETEEKGADGTTEPQTAPPADSLPEPEQPAATLVSKEVQSMDQGVAAMILEDTPGPTADSSSEEFYQDQISVSQNFSYLEGPASKGWITPSNIARHKEKDNSDTIASSQKPLTLIQVATLTTDFAMQNVLLQMNLNLISPKFQRIRNLKTHILRCHACFEKVKDMSKQFCPRCGKPTLTRVACSTNANGEFQMHLKKNMQWNRRGDRYSTPKLLPGSANGKVNVGGGRRSGGKKGWGQSLILAEDQKEYTRAMSDQKRGKERDLMDEDYLPSILTGDRSRNGGQPKIGAGRNVNSRRR